MEECSTDDVFFEYPVQHSQCTHQIEYSNDQSIVDSCKALATSVATCEANSHCQITISAPTADTVNISSKRLLGSATDGTTAGTSYDSTYGTTSGTTTGTTDGTSYDSTYGTTAGTTDATATGSTGSLT